MWQSNVNANQSQNLPSAVKNFNVFDILEPEKVNHKNTDNSTAILIDIGDSVNKLENSLDRSPELQGSFLDKVKKPEFDLVDLYENIYVTPQQIKKEPRDDYHTKNKIDFTELFDKAEQGKKLSELTKNDENVKSIQHIPQLYNNELLNNSRSFDEILDNAISLRCSKLELVPPPKLNVPKPDPICEDDIDEFLQPELVVGPSIFRESAPVSSVETISHLKKYKPHVSTLNLNHKSLSKPIEVFNTENVSKMPPSQLETQRSMYYSDVKSQPSYYYSLQENNLYKNKSKSESQLNVSPIYRNGIKADLTDVNSPQVNRIACQKESIPILNTVKKDPKAYLKRRIIKDDAEKIGFTKGPDIYEKSIVLPQIMKRLAERKQALEEQQSIQRKLILESGEKPKQIQNVDDLCVINGAVNIKSQAQVALKSGVSINQAACLMPEGAGKQGVSYLMPEGVAGGRKKEQGVARKQGEEKPAKLTAYQKPIVSLEPPAYNLETETYVSLEPIVLMADCSSKRINALKTRVAFEKFVNTGKLPP